MCGKVMSLMYRFAVNVSDYILCIVWVQRDLLSEIFVYLKGKNTWERSFR